MVRPAKMIRMTIGNGVMSLDRPPAGLETILSNSGRFLAVIWPKPSGHYVVQPRKLVYLDDERRPVSEKANSESIVWEETGDSSIVASLDDARQMARQILDHLDSFE